MPENWLLVKVRPGANRDAVLAELFAAGSGGVQELGDTIQTYFPDFTDSEALICAIVAASPDATVEISSAPAVDWSEQWKQGIHAQELGMITVAPPWLADAHDPAHTVVIDPGMAFGTGEHGTTRGVIRLMSRVVRRDDTVADLGAGSAVLSIAAAKLGAARATAIEIDPDAIGNAEENVARNGVSGRVSVIEGDAELLLPLVAPVRVVLANIISSVLTRLLPVIAASLTADGVAILSGILFAEREEFLEVVRHDGWRVLAEDHEDAWWTVTIARR